MTAKNIKLETVKLTSHDFDLAADLLAASFFDNPSHIYIFPDRNNRLKAIQWTLKCNLNLNYQQYIENSLHSQDTVEANIFHHSFALVEENQPPGTRQIKAMAFWNPPESDSVSWLSMIKEGLLTMPFRCGWGSFQRMFTVLEDIANAKKQVLNDTPAWYLNNMVVASELRGTGIGTQMLKDQLQTVVDPSGYAAILMTQKEANVRFYQRLGFEVESKLVLGKGKNAFTNWCLLRQAI